jgi:hypothetical protein
MIELDVVVHACNPSTQEVKTRDGRITISKPVWATIASLRPS